MRHVARYWMTVVGLCASSISVGAQSKQAPEAKAVKRAGTPSEIRAARDSALPRLSARWQSGAQTAQVGQHDCEVVLYSRKSFSDVETVDVQTVDVGLLSSRVTPFDDEAAGTQDQRISTYSGGPDIVRKRTRIFEGAPQREIVERVIFLAVVSGTGRFNTGNSADAAAALLAWSIPCERK